MPERTRQPSKILKLLIDLPPFPRRRTSIRPVLRFSVYVLLVLRRLVV